MLNISFFFPRRVVRKAIARVYIVMHQKQKENLRKLFKVSVQQYFSSYSPWISSVEHQMCKLTQQSKWFVKLMVTQLVKKFPFTDLKVLLPCSSQEPHLPISNVLTEFLSI
jgi:2-hydroxy-3-keto-5-methylthiopentenyl-1-phosphate phosphatase